MSAYFWFQCRTQLFPFAPTTASRSPSPARAGEAWLRAVFSQNHAISASPADAGERSTSANHTSFYSCSWDVFPYDLFPVQLCPMGLLLGQVSKWRAQRADRGAHAARGFVGGAAGTGSFAPDYSGVSMPHAALWVVQPTSQLRMRRSRCVFQCRTRLCGWCSNKVFSLKGATYRFNAARGFVGGAAPIFVQGCPHHCEFQCRTRLCGWCSPDPQDGIVYIASFQCRTRLCGWCSTL